MLPVRVRRNTHDESRRYVCYTRCVRGFGKFRLFFLCVCRAMVRQKEWELNAWFVDVRCFCCFFAHVSRLNELLGVAPCFSLAVQQLFLREQAQELYAGSVECFAEVSILCALSTHLAIKAT